MTPIHQAIGILTKHPTAGNAPTFGALQAAAHALSVQIARDVAPRWNLSASVSAYPTLASLPPGAWPIFVEPTIDDPDAEGYHTDANQQPYALVRFDKTWTVTVSHELIEMLIDPHGNRLLHQTLDLRGYPNQLPGLPANIDALTLIEACDPCEGETYNIAGIPVSDFVFPTWYSTINSVSGPDSGSFEAGADFLGRCKPGRLLRDGYVSYIDRHSNHWKQATLFSGHFKISDLGPATAEFHRGKTSTLRETTDQAARLKKATQPREEQ